MYMHNIDSSKNTIIEDYIRDTDYIYNNHSTIGNASGYVTKEELEDRSYTSSVFINTSIQEGIMCMDRSGMITTAKYKPNIRARDIASRTQSVDRTNKEDMTNGVYIVREWTIRTFRGMLAHCNVSLLDYYNNIESYIKLPDNELTILKSKLADMYGGVGKFGGTNDISIRSISYIPLNKLMEYKVVYDSHTDMVFTLGGVEKGLMHPGSVREAGIHHSDSENIKLDVNILEIEMIDSFSAGKKYYTMLGNNPVMLRSRTDKVKPDGVTVHVTSGGCRRHGYTVPKLDLNTVGIYNTEEEAKTAGDVKNGLEVSKLKLEYDKIEQQVSSLEHDKFKMEKERESIINKHKHELEVANLKIKSALFDYHKLANLAIIDIKTKMLDLKLKQTNHMTNRLEGIEKHQREMTLLKYKTAVEADKNKTKNYTTVLDTVVKYGSMLLK